jgi:outer membrane protein
MKQRILLLLCAMILFGGLLAPLPAESQDLKIAYIRSADVMSQYTEVRVATETLNRDVQAWNEEAQSRRRELDLLEAELSAQAPMLSDQVRRDKEQDYQKKLNEYDQYVQSVWGPGGLVAQRNEELLSVIVERIQTVARRLAAEEEFDFIFDASDGNIIYADREYDLTDKVINELNQTE